jgi:hypothetical protein
MILSNRESSPFSDTAGASSPLGASPHRFWKERDPLSPSRFGDSENSFSLDKDLTSTPKRSSIENLKKASRVKNSSMFAREQQSQYDPTRTLESERPLAKGRPLSTQIQASGFGGNGLAGLRDQESPFKGHRRGESQSSIPILSPTKSPGRLPTTEYTTSSPPTPAKTSTSPLKSSLTNGRASAAARAYDPEISMFSEDDSFKHPTARPLRRHAKSVTFDTAPPEVNEYEMVTPDPSAASGSREGSYDSEEFDDAGYLRADSAEQEDSFDASLEDTEKTPVVLPEDWRHMSPDAANTSLVHNEDDVFDGRETSPTPNARPNGVASTHLRAGSNTSDGSCRPLPPLPGLDATLNSPNRRESNGLAAAAERAGGAQRSLPSPPKPASVSKSDILNMRESSMTLQERLRLMGIQDSPEQGRDHSISPYQSPIGKDKDAFGIHVSEEEIDQDDVSSLSSEHVPRISRESILRKVKSRTFDDIHVDYEGNDYGDYADLDPDVPIPSREASSNFDNEVPDVPIKSEEDVEAYSIPDMYAEERRSPSRMEDYGRESSVVRYDENGQRIIEDEDNSSIYSLSLKAANVPETTNSFNEDEGPPTPKATDLNSPQSDKSDRSKRFSVPDFGSFTDAQFDLHLRSFMSGKKQPDMNSSIVDSAPKLESVRSFMKEESPEEEEEQRPASSESTDRPDTPDSVIRHPVIIEPIARESPVVPEANATIKAPGGGLKTRPSISPADADMMAHMRRQVSGERPPPIPERSPRRSSVGPEILSKDNTAELERTDSLKKLQLQVPISDVSEDLSFDMDKEFDRVVEAQKVLDIFPLPSQAQFPPSNQHQNVSKTSSTFGTGFIYQYTPANPPKKKGYLMRQNTKLVVASNRQFSDENPPPSSPTRPKSAGKPSDPESHRKPSDRGPTWTTEPWNGKTRRQSVRTASGSKKKAHSGPAPPLPGQASNVTGLDSVAEGSMIEDDENGTERGRLFVKVVGVKDLDLPLPQSKCT